MTVDIGVVGAGERGREYLETLGSVDGASVTAVVDVDEQTARRAADDHDAAAYGDHRALLETDPPDALFVCLPPFVHTDHELLAAERGIDLFVEPPVALSLETAREVEAAIEANDVVAQAGYQRRYADAFREAATVLEGRHVGMIDACCTSSPPGIDWWRERDKSGGQVVEQATHVYDAIRLLGGEVEEVTAYGENQLVDRVDFEDVVTASMRHGSGGVSHVESSSATSDRRTEVEVIAEDAHLRIRGSGFTGRVDGEPVEYEGSNDPSVEQVESFVAAADRGDDSRVAATYSEAVRTLALTFAVNESIRRDEPVTPAL